MTIQVLQGTLVLTDRLVEDGQIFIENGLITNVVTEGTRHAPTVDYGKAFIAPGFIDLHVHGIAGAEVMAPTQASLALMARRFAAHGVTGFLATTLTASISQLENVVDELRGYMAAEPDSGARMLGVHLEGPWISREFKGVQNEAHIVAPHEVTVSALIERGRGAVKRVSLAPEIPGADSVIRLLRSMGIQVSIAHTAATYDQVSHAVDLGARHVTHTFNAMTSLHHRRPGAAGAAMLSDDLFTELIADGIHVHPAVMRLLIRVKGRARVMVVTDAMAATELADGIYQLAGKEVFVRNGDARLADGTLASSTLTMDAAVRALIHLCQIPLVDAVYMSSVTPADAMGWGASKGKIRPGYDADLVVLDAALLPIATWIMGQAFSSN